MNRYKGSIIAADILLMVLFRTFGFSTKVAMGVMIFLIASELIVYAEWTISRTTDSGRISEIRKIMIAIIIFAVFELIAIVRFL